MLSISTMRSYPARGRPCLLIEDPTSDGWSSAIGVDTGTLAAVHIRERASVGTDDFGGLLSPPLPPEIRAVAEESDPVRDVDKVAENVVAQGDGRRFHRPSVWVAPRSRPSLGWNGWGRPVEVTAGTLRRAFRLGRDAGQAGG